jgi:Big-like domain-containing protein
MTRLVVLLAALLAAAAAVQGSQATFTASATNAGSSFATNSNFPPVLTLTAPTSGATTNGLPTLSGAAGNSTGDSNTVNVKIYNGTGTGGTVAQSKAVTRSGATWTWTLTTALATGTYTAQATQSDGVNTTTTAALTFTVDATKPTATSVVAANKTGGTAGKIENGDAMTFSYSEAITAASVWSGWDGTSTSVNVRFTNSGTADTVTILSPTTGTINLGSVATNGNYVSATTTFTSTMVRSANGASIVVTLGTPASVQATAVTAKNMAWTVGAGITDLAGNAIATPASVTESVSTVDF